MSEDGDDEAYYRAIEEEFVRRRRAPILLSPRDWALIGEWRREGVPLRVANVFDAFERRAPAARRINSLSYCRQEVATLHDIHRSLHGVESGRPAAGGGTGVDAALVRHLGRITRRVRKSMALASEAGLDALVAALASAAAEIRRLRRAVKAGDLDPQRLEDEMRGLDEMVLEAARRSLSPAELRRIEAEVDARLRERADRMTAGALDATRRSHVAHLLRQRCRIPRRTLFD
ncbi:MAG: hypothetical protein ACE5JH_00245 [Acidobacteriota bacterium]